MGYGDDLMGTGLARMIKNQYPDAQVVFGNPDSYLDPETNKLSVQWSEVFENNPLIVHPDQPCSQLICIPDYMGHRVYIDYENSKTAVIDGINQYEQFAWMKEFKAPKGELYFTNDEKSAASEIAMRLPWPYVVIEPHVAAKPWINHKAWPYERWQAVVDALPEVHFVQLSDGEILNGVHQVITPSFRQACGLIACAGAVITSEGGTHHAAAALDIPAVVLWGHYTSPDILGYDDHINIRHAKGIGCGKTYLECPECLKSMHDIKVDEVVEAIKGLMKDGRHHISRENRGRPIFRMVGETPEGQKK
jgi:hypothetical protein